MSYPSMNQQIAKMLARRLKYITNPYVVEFESFISGKSDQISEECLIKMVDLSKHNLMLNIKNGNIKKEMLTDAFKAKFSKKAGAYYVCCIDFNVNEKKFYLNAIKYNPLCLQTLSQESIDFLQKEINKIILKLHKKGYGVKWNKWINNFLKA